MRWESRSAAPPRPTPRGGASMAIHARRPHPAAAKLARPPASPPPRLGSAQPGGGLEHRSETAYNGDYTLFFAGFAPRIARIRPDNGRKNRV